MHVTDKKDIATAAIYSPATRVSTSPTLPIPTLVNPSPKLEDLRMHGKEQKVATLRSIPQPHEFHLRT